MPMSNEMWDTFLIFFFFNYIPVNCGIGYVLKYKVYLVVFWLLDSEEVIKCPWKWPALGSIWVLAVRAWEMWCNHHCHFLVSVSSLPNMWEVNSLASSTWRTEISDLRGPGWGLRGWWCRRWQGCDSPKALETLLTVASLRNMWRGVLISRMRRWRLSGSGTHPQFKPTAHHTWSQSHPVNHGAELGSKLDLTSSPLLLCCCRLLDRNAPNASSARPPACCDVRSLKRGPGRQSA